MADSTTIKQRAQAWANNTAFTAEHRGEIQKLLDQWPASEAELTERFYQGLEFGTGGMRGHVAMGENRINVYTIRRATQSFATVLKRHFNGEITIVVSYDSRLSSVLLAQETCAVMAAHGIKAIMFKALTPTPMLSYAIRMHKAQGGVMVTASHNPPSYNGYKAFWADGGQVVPPYDKEIITEYNAFSDWHTLKTIPFNDALKKGMIRMTNGEEHESFYRMIEEKVIIDLKMCREHGKEVKIIYTPLHGAGLVPCQDITKRLGFSEFKVLPSQAAPDGNFPTVKYPNPEDPKALALSVEEMLKTNADLVFATDPDCDRLGVAVNHHGQVHYISGNQIAALFLDYIFKARTQRGTLPKNPLVIKTIVTSPIQEAISSRYGARVESTLTGFKWMADLIAKEEQKNKDFGFVFASEESFGYMPHCESRDKDGVGAVALMSEVALYHKRQGHTLIDALDVIYQEVGFFAEILVSQDYEGITGAEKIKRIMNFFRSPTGAQSFGEVAISYDYKARQMTDHRMGSKISELTLPSSDVLGFILANQDRIFLRPSGTEPKIKFYVMVQVTQGNLVEKKQKAASALKQYEQNIRQICEGI